MISAGGEPRGRFRDVRQSTLPSPKPGYWCGAVALLPLITAQRCESVRGGLAAGDVVVQAAATCEAIWSGSAIGETIGETSAMRRAGRVNRAFWRLSMSGLLAPLYV